MTFDEFIADTWLRNAWVKEPGVDLYVRRSIHKGVDYDLANMSAKKPGKGSLTRFLDEYERKYTFFVENIHNQRLEQYLKRRGYVQVRCSFGSSDLRSR